MNAIEHGDARASEQLLPLVYDELRRLAAQKMAQEASGQTLEAAGLVHEVYLRLLGPEEDRSWDGRGHFCAAAAKAMRRILIETSRRKRTEKHGGGRQRFDLNEAHLASNADPDLLLALDEALVALAEEDPVAAELGVVQWATADSVCQRTATEK